MRNWGSYLLPACVLLFLAWAALSTYVILNRALYDLRRRFVRAAQQRLKRQAMRARNGVKPDVRGILSSLPRRTVEEIAVDSNTPRDQAAAFAEYVRERWGRERLAKAAFQHHGETGKWKRVEALRMLAVGRDPCAIGLLERALRDRDPDVVGAAVVLLSQTGEEAAARLLVDALRQRMYVPSRIATQLDRFSLPIPHLLRPLLYDSVPVVRFWAATLFARYAGETEINHELALLVNDPNADVRKAAVETLGKVGGPHATETAVQLINDPVWYVRAHAARALGDLRRTEFCGLVMPLLADRKWWVRKAAKDALQAMGPGVAHELVPYLDSPDLFARNGAAEVFQNLGIIDTSTAEVLNRQRDDPDRLELIGKIMAAERKAKRRLCLVGPTQT